MTGRTSLSVPASAAVNPALTIAAMGLRVGQKLKEQYQNRSRP
ncbi:hypothetical protein [Oceanispirochaeta sp.]|jgi:choline dehydrogenase-like flavoprotein|nr:hypothetical protein [Oceanispirochaeta sp.]MDA3958596.1 hypothetical protein [Oceanispirochaeta sp.]